MEAFIKPGAYSPANNLSQIHSFMADEQTPYALCDVPTVVGEPGDYAESFYWDMAITHNCYLRGFNSAYINAPKVTPKDETSFMGYCLVVSTHSSFAYSVIVTVCR